MKNKSAIVIGAILLYFFLKRKKQPIVKQLQDDLNAFKGGFSNFSVNASGAKMIRSSRANPKQTIIADQKCNCNA